MKIYFYFFFRIHVIEKLSTGPTEPTNISELLHLIAKYLAKKYAVMMLRGLPASIVMFELSDFALVAVNFFL